MTYSAFQSLLIIAISILSFLLHTRAIHHDSSVSTGTTILAVRYQEGVIVGADTRTSVSGYVSNRYANKITFILDKERDLLAIPFVPDPSMSQLYNDGDNESISSISPAANAIEGSTCCICRSGSSADTQYLADVVQLELVSRQILDSCPNTVSNVASLLRYIMSQDDNLLASLICAGYDHMLKRGTIYSLSPGGAWMEEPIWTTSGSGSSFITGYVESKLSGILLDEEEAIAMVSAAIEFAIHRDTNSGGYIVLYVINKNGKRMITHRPKNLKIQR